MNTPESKLVKVLSWIILVIFALLPLHAFLTVWLSTIAGHYTLLRLWKEILLTVLVIGAAFILARDRKLRATIFSTLLFRLIGLYCLITVVLGGIAYSLHKVALKALAEGVVINLRYLVFFFVVYVVVAKSPLVKKVWPRVVLIPAAAVIGFGLLQRMVLPYDFLKHFGYGENTIYPYETINHNINYPRVMSSLRGANPLGAYLVLVLTVAASFFMRAKNKKWMWAILVVLGSLVLIFCYSRAAWIGMLISLLVLLWMILKNQQLKNIILAGLFVVSVLGCALAWTLRHNTAFENIVFHTQHNSTIRSTSDQGHASAFKNGLHDLIHNPLGDGPGTAGPASFHNTNHQPRIAENYYLQIGQEVGILGLFTFIAINLLVAKQLWIRKDQQLAQILLASLVGITFVNMLSHAWTDDTLCYLWWGLAGIVIAPILTSRQKTYGKKYKEKS
jgi:hypothetical protein